MELRHQPKAVLSDGEIIDLYWKRDEQAIKETDRKYQHFLLTVAHNILRNGWDCEECLNDTYLGAWNAIPPARPKALQAFLATIMRRTAIDRYKAVTRQKRIDSELTVALSEVEELLTDGSDPAAELDARELGRVISAYIRSLPKRRRYIFMSRYYMARPIGEIAELLGCSESTVNKEIAAIKRGLREALEKEGYSL
ncbi:MAG: sigma-70 family RNA polymerase sigma factor [Clostridia bacterium]|nr:sigma-70 family RNA polymerase sigma factor [Clostridia bacterium]